jgi:hypothetical protein
MQISAKPGDIDISRQNLFLNDRVRGMNEVEIDRRFLHLQTALAPVALNMTTPRLTGRESTARTTN